MYDYSDFIELSTSLLVLKMLVLILVTNNLDAAVSLTLKDCCFSIYVL